MNEDFYSILEVSPRASDAEIERAYRRLARAYHPDLLRHAPPEDRRTAEERLKGINRAYHSLGDRERRMAYDRQRRQALVGALLAPPPAARSAAPNGARAARAGDARPVEARTTYRAGGGPIDIEWTTAPPVVVRPATDLFTVGRLLRYALLIILFGLLLGLLWHPNVAPLAAPAPTPGVTTTIR